MRAGRADVSLRDVTIAQMKNGARECGWCHAPEARGGFGGFWKSQWIEFCLRRRRLAFACSPKPGQCVGGGRWKSQNWKNVYLSFLCRRTFKLKGNKKFCTWTNKSCLRVSGFLCSMYKCYKHSMYILHIRIWLWYIWMSINLMKGNGFTLKKARSKWYSAKTVTGANYADDIALLANTPNWAKSQLHCLEQAASGIDFHVNGGKVKDVF